MSLTSSDPTKGTLVHTAIGETCFYCGRPTTDPAWFWMGATSEIFLHLSCAVDLGIRLFSNVHEWQVTYQAPKHFGDQMNGAT